MARTRGGHGGRRGGGKEKGCRRKCESKGPQNIVCKRKGGPRLQWREEDMLKAIDAIQQGMSQREAVAAFGVNIIKNLFKNRDNIIEININRI